MARHGSRYGRKHRMNGLGAMMGNVSWGSVAIGVLAGYAIAAMWMKNEKKKTPAGAAAEAAKAANTAAAAAQTAAAAAVQSAQTEAAKMNGLGMATSRDLLLNGLGARQEFLI